MIADSSSIPRSKVTAAQAFSLTRAPIPTAIPADLVLPRRPPVLEEGFRNRVVRLAFEYGFSQFNLVQEHEFCVDMLERPCAPFSFRGQVQRPTTWNAGTTARPTTPPSCTTSSSPSAVVTSPKASRSQSRSAARWTNPVRAETSSSAGRGTVRLSCRSRVLLDRSGVDGLSPNPNPNPFVGGTIAHH